MAQNVNSVDQTGKVNPSEKMNTNTIIFGVALIFALTLVVNGSEHQVNKKHGHGHGHESRSHLAAQRHHQLKHGHHSVRDGGDLWGGPGPICPPCNCDIIWEEVVSENGDSGVGTSTPSPVPPPPPPTPLAVVPSPSPAATSESPAARKRGRLAKNRHGHSARAHHH